MQLLRSFPGRRDPWWEADGKGARRHRARIRLQGVLAFALAVFACGLTAAAWFRILIPLWHELGLS